MAEGDLEFAFRKTRLLSRRTIIGMVSLVIFQMVGFVSVVAHPNARAWRINVVAAAAMLLCYAAIRFWRERRLGQTPPIVLTADTLTLPVADRRGRSRTVPLADIRSVGVIGPGWNASVLVDTRRRVFAYAKSSFVDDDAAARLRGAVTARLAALPDGAGLAADIERRHEQADAFAAIVPWGTRFMVLLTGGCFLWQLAELRHRDMFGLLDIGAGAPPLIWHGEWYRLVAANLLHASPQHLLQNGLSLLVTGAIVERLVGLRMCLILLLSTCIAAQLASAAIAPWTAMHLYSVGISGGIFGLLGALGVLTWRFGETLPGGGRISGIRWAVLLLVNAALIPWLVPHVDWAAHAGGALAGCIGGALLCRGTPDAGALRRPRAWSSEAFAGLAFVWVLAGGLTVWYAHDPATRIDDRRLLVEDLLVHEKPPPALRNMVAWAVVQDPASGALLLQRARALEGQALVQQRRLDGNSWAYVSDIDTLAGLAYRLGETQTAAFLLKDEPWRSAPMGTHLAQFLDQLVLDRHMITLGTAHGNGGAPTVTIGRGVMRLTVNDAMEQGGRLYGVVHHGGALAGVIFFHLPPGFSGTQVLPLPSSMSFPGTEAPPALWTDGTTTISAALIDWRGCHCQNDPTMGPTFAPYSADAALPPA